ncbi:MAG: transporter substrate-binding domain-containing protein [Acetanaerobacterium sp.]
MKVRKLILSMIAAAAVFAMMAGCAGGAKAGNSLERVMDNGKLTVVGSGGYRPFNYIDDTGKVIGFDVDTGAEIAKRMGVELDYVTSDWDGLVEGLKNARYDGILGSMAITDERLLEVNFTIPYYYSGAQLIVRSDSGITDPSEMSGKNIAVATGTNFVEDAEGLGAEVSLYQDDNATMMELINGRVDGVITDRLVAVEAMNNISGGDQLVFAGEIMRLEEMAIAVNKNDTELLEKLNEILTEMHDDGSLSEISSKWHGGADITVK